MPTGGKYSATGIRLMALAAIALAVLPAYVRADGTLTTADFAVKGNLTLVEWNLKDSLAYTDNSGKVASVPSRQVVSYALDRKVGSSDSPCKLTLRNGDVLMGTLTGMHDQLLEFTSADAGLVRVPIKVIAALQFGDHLDAASAPQKSGADADDVLELKNGDVVKGAFLSTTADKIQMQSEAGPVSLDVNLAGKLTLAGSSPPRLFSSLSACITFVDGSKLTTASMQWTADSLVIGDPAGQEVKVSPDKVVSVSVQGGRVVWLDELTPAKDEQVSLLGASWPTRVDRNVVGGPLQTAAQTFSRGLGVHSTSRLVYDLDGSFATLTLRCGLDDSASPLGQVAPSIVLDGKVIWTPKDTIMKSGEISDPITLHIAGGRKLELCADPGARFDVLGRFNWLAPALIRP